MKQKSAVLPVADYQNLCGECPVWDEQFGALYWTDNAQPKLYRFDAATGEHGLFHEGLTVAAFRLNRPGGFVIGNNHGIFLWDGKGQPRLICATVDGARCQINDGAADPAGRFIAGSCFYNPRQDFELGKLFLIERNGTARVLDEGFMISNGLGFSPDGTLLYFTDSAVRTIYRYDYDAARGAVSNRRIFVRVPDGEGLPDGLCVDAEGYVWSAQWYGNSIVRYDPDGKVERRIATPAKQTSSLCFGGPDLTDIFITSAGLSEPMPIMPPGYDPESGYVGGALFLVRTELQGKAECKANILLSG